MRILCTKTCSQAPKLLLLSDVIKLLNINVNSVITSADWLDRQQLGKYGIVWKAKAFN